MKNALSTCLVAAAVLVTGAASAGDQPKPDARPQPIIDSPTGAGVRRRPVLGAIAGAPENRGNPRLGERGG